MLEDSFFYQRLALELDLLEKEEPTFHAVNGDPTTIEGIILGTGIYEGGVFKIEIRITRNFPFEPPQVRFLTPIWHPNINLNGRVCVGILGKDWTPSMNLVGVVETLRNLLNYPNPNDPLNRDAADEMLHNKRRFEENVRKYIQKYANWSKVDK